MTNQPPLNPDGLLNAMDTLMAETDADERATEWAHKVTTRVLEAYLAVAQPESTRDQRIALGRLLNKALLQCGISATYALSGPSELYDVAGILLREYPTLAVAQPVVNSVEELDALPNGSIIQPLTHPTKSVVQRDQYGKWAVAGHPGPYSTEMIYLGLHGGGARVLYRPEVDDA